MTTSLESPTAPEEISSPEAKPTPADLAARDFPVILASFKKMLESSSCAGKKLKDVFVALMEYPLESNSYAFKYPDQQELYLIGTKLFDCRMLIVREIFDLKKDEIEAMVAELLKQEEKKNESV